MSLHFYVHHSKELTRLIYDYIDDWSDRLEFTCLNTKVMEMCFNQRTNLIYDVQSTKELNQRFNLPIATAMNFRLSDNIDLKQKLIYSLIKNVTICRSIIINTSYEINIRVMEKVCKTSAKRGVNLIIEESPQKEIFDEMAAKYKKKFDELNNHFNVNRGQINNSQPKRKMMEVPIDPVKRLKLYLNETYKLANNITTRYVADIDRFVIPSLLHKVVDPKTVFTLYQSNITEIGIPTLTNIISKSEVDSYILIIGKRFVNSFIKFENHIFYITSIDTFIHNNTELDDCAYGLDTGEYYQQPRATVYEKTNMIGLKFYELSIFWGIYEFLAVGGYFGTHNGKFIPFLGSSLKEWEYGSLSDGLVYKSSTENDVICTERLLIQYRKRDSIRPFGLHYLPSAFRGFSPIIPLHFLNHQSQQRKHLTLNHFASKLLFIITSRQQIQKEVMSDLFHYFSSVKEFQQVCPDSNKDNCITFSQFNKVWMKKECKKTVFMELLIDTACLIEAKLEQLGSCLLCSSFKAEDLSKKALGIMKLGLKAAISYQDAQIVKKEKTIIL